MMRRTDWAERLYDFMESRRAVPFAWSANDCASFAGDAVEAMTGGRVEIPRAATPAAYARLLRDQGSLQSMAAALLGDPIAPAYAQRGDVVLLLLDERETLGICVGADIAGPGGNGLVLVPMAHAVSAWRI
jgi:hypothetical protein